MREGVALLTLTLNCAPLFAYVAEGEGDAEALAAQRGRDDGEGTVAAVLAEPIEFEVCDPPSIGAKGMR